MLCLWSEHTVNMMTMIFRLSEFPIEAHLYRPLVVAIVSIILLVQIVRSICKNVVLLKRMANYIVKMISNNISHHSVPNVLKRS